MVEEPVGPPWPVSLLELEVMLDAGPEAEDVDPDSVSGTLVHGGGGTEGQVVMVLVTHTTTTPSPSPPEAGPPARTVERKKENVKSDWNE